MSSVNESVVREYFEMLGYFVIQPRKYIRQGRQKLPVEELDLLVTDPHLDEQCLPDHMVWSTEDLAGVARAVVGVRGWHTERFYVSTFEQMPEILRFVEDAPIHSAEKLLGSGPVAKILCLPKLPSSGALKKQTIRVLKEKGVDGVISFRTILTELVARVDKGRNYEKSDLLQMIRLLKSYDLVRTSQMELFEKRRERR